MQVNASAGSSQPAATQGEDGSSSAAGTASASVAMSTAALRTSSNRYEE